MTSDLAEIRWTTKCLPCGHEHVEETEYTTEVEYAPPPIPNKCRNCEAPLEGDPVSYYQKFIIEAVHEFD